MKHLYFVRHGLSEHNIAGIYSGQTETPLSKEGRVQASMAGEIAKELHIDYIISSPYERALETAQIIAREIGYPLDEIELNDNLVERHFGELEGTPWLPDRDVDNEPGVESPADLEARVKRAYEHILTLPYDNILVASHGSTGRMFRHVIDESVPFVHPDPKIRAEHRFANAKITQLV